jgi:uncharacterized protein YecT (DUF1311 family)
MTGLGLLPLLLALAATAQPAFEDCDASYYGLDRARALRRAFDCYKRQEQWDMLTVLYLNGEGTPRDVARARETFNRIAGATGKLGERPATFAKLEELLKARERDPSLRERIDYCDDVAQDTVTMNGCLRVVSHRAQQAQNATLAEARKGLGPAALRELDAVEKAFAAFVDAEKSRAYQDFIEGSARDQAANGQAEFLRRQFEARARGLLGDVKKPLTSQRPYAAADAELNQVYRGVLQTYVGGCEERARTAADEQERARLLGWAAEYRKLAHETQRRWIRYRDAWAELVAEVRPAHARPLVLDAVKALITEDRIRELNHNPLGAE